MELAKAEDQLKKWADALHERDNAHPSPPPRPAQPLSSARPPSVSPTQVAPHKVSPAPREEVLPESPAPPEPQQAANLLPRRRPRREIRATTASYGGPAKLFGDKLMMRVMKDPQRIPAGKFYKGNFDAFLVPTALAPGNRFGIGVDDGGEAHFGPVQEGAALAGGLWFEAEVLAVRRPSPDNPKDQGGVVFQVRFLVMPHPNGDANSELAIPIDAVVLRQPTDDRPDFRGREADNEKTWSAIGQLTHGPDGYFSGGAASVLLSKLNNIYIGKDQAGQCFFMGKVKRETPCFIRIDKDAVF